MAGLRLALGIGVVWIAIVITIKFALGISFWIEFPVMVTGGLLIGWHVGKHDAQQRRERG